MVLGSLTQARSRDNIVWKIVPYIDNSVSKIVFGDINSAMTFVQFKLITFRRIIRPVINAKVGAFF